MWAWMSFTNFIRLQLCKFSSQATTKLLITAGSNDQFECLPVQGDVWSVSMKAWLSPTLALFTEKHFWKNSLTPKCFAHCTNEKSTEGGGSSLYVKKKWLVKECCKKVKICLTAVVGVMAVVWCTHSSSTQPKGKVHDFFKSMCVWKVASRSRRRWWFDHPVQRERAQLLMRW